LPPDIQKIIQQVSDEWPEKEAANWFALEKSGKDFGVSKGVKSSPSSKEENDKVVKAIQPLFDDYVQKMKKAGLPGKKR